MYEFFCEWRIGNRPILMHNFYDVNDSRNLHWNRRRRRRQWHPQRVSNQLHPHSCEINLYDCFSRCFFFSLDFFDAFRLFYKSFVVFSSSFSALELAFELYAFSVGVFGYSSDLCIGLTLSTFIFLNAPCKILKF